MALIELKFFSQMLGMQTEAYVVMPQKSTKGQIGIGGATENKEYKCLYLLHGLTDDHTIWLRRTSIERYAALYGICIIMPCGGRSFYTDMKYGGKYFTYITEELPRVVAEFLNVSTKREDTFIAGNSMGGYGALKAALKKPDRYSAVAGFSSVTNIKNERFSQTLVPVFGEELEIPNEEDLFYLAEQTESAPLKPRIFTCVGTEDFLYKENVMFKEKLENLNYDFTYVQSKGEHCWDFWDEHIKQVLEWMFGEK